MLQCCNVAMHGVNVINMERASAEPGQGALKGVCGCWRGVRRIPTVQCCIVVQYSAVVQCSSTVQCSTEGSASHQCPREHPAAWTNPFCMSLTVVAAIAHSVVPATIPSNPGMARAIPATGTTTIPAATTPPATKNAPLLDFGSGNFANANRDKIWRIRRQTAN